MEHSTTVKTHRVGITDIIYFTTQLIGEVCCYIKSLEVEGSTKTTISTRKRSAAKMLSRITILGCCSLSYVALFILFVNIEQRLTCL